MHCGIERYPACPKIRSSRSSALSRPRLTAKVVLLHGGDVQVLRYAELVRFNAKLILDLSMTIMKYRGSSVDAEGAFLFRHFDRRICIGSDHPEYSHAQLRAQFEDLAHGIDREKAENIAFRNITAFLGCAEF